MGILTYDSGIKRIRNDETGELYSPDDLIIDPAVRVLARNPDGKDNITPQLSRFPNADGIVVYPFNPAEERIIEPGDEKMVRVAPYKLRLSQS